MRAALIVGLSIALLPALAGAGETQIAAAKAAVERTLIDPESVRYRDLHEAPGKGVCGQYNAKNSYGGYVGFKGFAWTEATGQVITDDGYLGEGVPDDHTARAHTFADMGCPSRLDIFLEVERRLAAGK